MAKTKIMVVEDENIVAKDIQNRLESLGYRVTSVVATGEKALQEITENVPDLVLMDIMLKGNVDGVQAAERIRERISVPIVYLTAYADQITLDRAKITEPYGYLLKPFEKRELCAAIEIALCRYATERKLKENEHRLATTLKSIADAVSWFERNNCI